MEAIQNIRTVVQLSKKQHFDDQYSQILDTVSQYCDTLIYIYNRILLLIFVVDHHSDEFIF
jgi:hypothetical protein